MRVYITKYALTKGIFETEATPGPYEDFITAEDGTIYHKEFYATTEREARLMANNMRSQKIESYDRRIERLKQLDFMKIKDYRYLKI